MEESLTRIAASLQATLSADQQQRQAAELALQEGQLQPGHAVALFRLAVDMTLQVEPVLRQTAAVHMKNVINRRWDPPKKPLRGCELTIPLSEPDKASIRDNLVEAVCVSTPQVRVQLGTCLRTAAGCDYPDQWPTLLPNITANLSSSEPARLYGGLFCLRVLAKVHQYRRERTQPLHALVAETFPLLLQLLRSLLTAPPSVANSELATLASKIMWSAIQIDLPPMLLQPAALEPWFETLLGLLAQPLPDGGPTDIEEASQWAPWKARKRALQIMHRVLQRYGNPASAKEKAERDEASGAAEMTFGGEEQQALTQLASAEDDKARTKAERQARAAFARAFQDQVSGKCLAAGLTIMQRVGRGEVLPGRVHMLCLSYVEEAIKYKATYTAILKPQLEALFREVIYPPLCFNANDAELWESDPQEYVRRSLDVIEDYYSPRTAATNLLVALTNQRAKDTLAGIVAACSAVLNSTLSQAAPQALMQKDGALLALGSLRKHLAKREQYKLSLEPMLRTHVLPLLQAESGFMRQRACWVYAQFALAVFSPRGDSVAALGGPGSPAAEQMGHAFPLVMGLLRDRDLPVRVQAAITIKELVEQQCMPDALVPQLPTLMELLFSLLQEVGADEIVATVDTLIEHYGEQMVPYAVQVVSALTSSFLRLVDESDEDAEDDATLAALGVMQALGTMMDAISQLSEEGTTVNGATMQKADIYRAMEAPLLPLFVRCTEQDAEDYFEEMLELLSYVTFYTSEVSPELWELVPRLHAVYHNWGKDYLNNMAVPLDNFVTRSPEAFLTLQGGQFVQMIVSICRDGLVSEHMVKEAEEGDSHGAPKLVESMLLACRGRLDSVVPDLIACLLMRLDSIESKAMRTLLYTALSAAIHYNPILALQVLEHRQVTTTLLTSWANYLSTSERLRAHDYKLGLLGASALLALPNDSAPQMVVSNRLHLLRLGLTVHRRLEAAREKKRADEEGAGEEEDDEEEEDDDDDEEVELDDEEEGGKEMSTAETLARLLRHAAGETSLKKFNLAALTGEDEDDEDDDDLSDDESNTDSPIDCIDEHVAFVDAAQAASTHDPELLAKAGLNPSPAVAQQLSAEETAALRATLEAGVAKKYAGGAPQP